MTLKEVKMWKEITNSLEAIRSGHKKEKKQ